MKCDSQTMANRTFAQTRCQNSWAVDLDVFDVDVQVLMLTVEPGGRNNSSEMPSNRRRITGNGDEGSFEAQHRS